MIEFRSENIFLLIVLLILLLMFLISAFTFDKTYKAEIRILKEEDSYYAITYIPNEDFQTIYNKPLMFQDKYFDYEIISIENQYYLDTEYKILKLKANLEKQYLKEENVLAVNFRIRNTTIFDEVLEFIKKGISG